MASYIDPLIAFVSAHAWLAYLTIFLAALLEAVPVVGSVIPGSTIILALSALVPGGDLRLEPVLADANPKGRLQERVQPAHGNNALRYEVTRITGEDHAREYEVEVYLVDRALGCGQGPSKKLAEESAARMALETLDHEGAG